jgi:hypothetical protein
MDPFLTSRTFENRDCVGTGLTDTGYFVLDSP